MPGIVTWVVLIVLSGAQRSHQLLLGGLLNISGWKKTHVVKLILGVLKIPFPVGISWSSACEESLVLINIDMRETGLSAFRKRIQIVDLQNTWNMVYLILEEMATALRGAYLLDKRLLSLCLQVPTPHFTKAKKTCLVCVVGIFLWLGLRVLTCEYKEFKQTGLRGMSQG